MAVVCPSSTTDLSQYVSDMLIDEDPRVHLTPSSSLRGIWKKPKCESHAAKKVAAFLGVPFAEPPVGERRFSAPVPCSLWKGERKAQEFGSFCPQDIRSTREVYFPMHLEDNQSEDCLFLNVWTPSLEKSKKFPVMIWIHGGSFVQGCSNYFEGTSLCSMHDVVYVSFSYRVGPFGFLCMDDERVQGNMGILDQIEALKWVQRHIGSFNGDPNNVTVFGESCGSICLSMLLTSPLVRGRGLFKRAIMQSGSCLYSSNCQPAEKMKKKIQNKLKALGADAVSTGNDLVKFLEEKSAEEIRTSLDVAWAPVRNDTVFVEKCSNLYERGEFEKVEAIIGFNTHEGAYWGKMLEQAVGALTPKAAEDFFKGVIYNKYFENNENVDLIYKEIHNEYLKGKTDSEELIRTVVDFVSDIALIIPSIHNAICHSERVTTYLYQFDHRPFFSQHAPWVTADHWDDVPYVFGEAFLGRMPEWSKTEQQLSRTFMSYWTNFAKTGNPNGEDLSNWPAYNSTSREMLMLSPVPSIRSNYNPTRVRFWLEHIKNIASGSLVAVAHL